MSIKGNYFIGFDTLFVVALMAAMMVACGGGGAGGSATSPTLNQTGTGSGTLITIPTTTGNSISLVVDAGPVPNSAPSVNVAYVTVTVCTPRTSGSTAACQTIDHVTLDTGSSGLRILNSVLSSKMNLPAATTNGQAIGECVPYVVGATWGSVRYADIYIGGEVARYVPIQDIGDSPGGATTTACSNYGTLQDTQTQLGSNGILGVGSFVSDSGYYYACTSSGCNPTTLAVSQMVSNPVVSFATDNNGTVITLPAVSSNGYTTALTGGKLIFGIGTQLVTNTSTNIVSNTIPNSASVFTIDASGNFTTYYNNTYLTRSYLDSGSNALFFNDSIALCTYNTWTYCPASTTTLSATNSSASGTPAILVSSPAPTIVNADSLFSNINIVAGNIGGPAGPTSPNTFAWGLPFFYGRTVFTAIEGASTLSGTGPYWAY